MWNSAMEWLGNRVLSSDKGKRRQRNAAVFLLLVLPVSVIGAYSYIHSREELSAGIYARRQSVALLAASTLREKLDQLKQIGTSLTTRPRVYQLISEGKWNDAVEFLRRVPKDFPFIDRLFLTEPDGTLRVDTPALPGIRGRNFAFRDWYRGVSRDWEPYVSDTYRRTAEPRLNVIATAVPVKSESGRTVGILVLQTHLQALVEWTQQIEVGRTGFVYLVDRQGQLVAHPKFPPEIGTVDFSTVPVVQKVLGGERGIEVGWNPIEKEERLSAYEPVPGYGWGVIVQQPAAEAFAARDAGLRRILIAYGLVLLFAVALAFFILRAMSERERAEAKIRASEREARVSETKFRALLESAPDAIIVVDERGRIVLSNDQAEKAFGYSRDELSGQPVETLVPARFRQAHIAHCDAYQSHPRRRAMGDGPDLYGRRKDGSEFPVRIGLSPVTTPDGGLVMGIVSDITERKRVENDVRRLNEELKQRAVELEAANKELEAFSYSVSHDLRAPLRAIDGFSRILLEKHLPHLAAEGQRYLGLVRDNAKQMGELIDDLLTFSRLSRQPVKRQPVKPAELARRALQEFGAEHNGRLRVSIGDLPPCQGDPALLKQVYVNLLSNAVKFTRRRETAEIEVGCRQKNGEPVYFVKDNGVGFDMQYAHKLFGVFQRLHRPEEYEGTGVGLAIVQRVVHRHGGRVWAEAEPDKGATFYFTLPL